MCRSRLPAEYGLLGPSLAGVVKLPLTSPGAERPAAVAISMDIGQYRADVRRRAAIYAVRATRQLGGEARHRALAAARNLTAFFPEARVHALIRAAAEETRPAGSLG